MKDILGAACSGLCMIHCIGLPILAATGTSFIGVAYFSGESAHLWLAAFMVAFALLSFPSGWRKHKRVVPSLLAGVGISLMALAIYADESLEAYYVMAAGITLIAGHLTNRHLLTAKTDTALYMEISQ
jgi:hypothetical protein